MSDRTVLLTGATGFVGRHVLASLLDGGWDVHGVSRRQPDDVAATPHHESSNLTWHFTDLLDRAATQRLVARIRPAYLVHLAWNMTPGRYMHGPSNAQWAEAGRDLIETFYNEDGSHVLVAGTGAEYGPSERPCHEHRTPVAPETAYGRAKVDLQRHVERSAEESDRTHTWARLFNIYGPGEHPARLVPSVSRAIVSGRTIPLTDGRQTKDYLHVADAAEGIVAALEHHIEGPVNIASGEGVTVRYVAETLAGTPERRALLDFGARGQDPTGTRSIVADVTRIRMETGWQRRIALAEGLETTLDWWRRQETGK